jgi:hypothetical protein
LGLETHSHSPQWRSGNLEGFGEKEVYEKGSFLASTKRTKERKKYDINKIFNPKPHLDLTLTTVQSMGDKHTNMQNHL